jgi:parvulin-like peptidyl-prolyl isomerase
MHYYQSQQGVNFATDDGKRQLQHFKQESMQQAVNQAYIKELAKQHHVSVSAQEVNNQVRLVRQQNRLGASDAVFRNVLQQFWGWSVADFKRELNSELLEQKVVAKLDTATNKQALDALSKLKGGADFATLAQQVSDDAATAANGGDYGFDIDASNQNVSPQAFQAISKLKVGQYSEIINSGTYLEIDKLLQVNGNKFRAAHITFDFKDPSTYINKEKKKNPTHYLIHV